MGEGKSTQGPLTRMPRIRTAKYLKTTPADTDSLSSMHKRPQSLHDGDKLIKTDCSNSSGFTRINYQVKLELMIFNWNLNLNWISAEIWLLEVSKYTAKQKQISLYAYIVLTQKSAIENLKMHCERALVCYKWLST